MALAYPDPELADDGLRLRRWTHGDLDCVRAASADDDIVRVSSVPEFSVAAGGRFIDRQLSRARTGAGLSLAIADPDGDAVGLLYLAVRPQPLVLGVGFWLVPAARGRGLARRAVALAAHWALRSGGITRVEAWVEPGNRASQRVLEAAGFTREGVLREFLRFGPEVSDAVVFSLVTRDLPPLRTGQWRVGR
jgi:ribosomal-protein-alanine N-acetyltransferase